MVEGHSISQNNIEDSKLQVPIITVSSPAEYIETDGRPIGEILNEDELELDFDTQFDTYNVIGVVSLKIGHTLLDKQFRTLNNDSAVVFNFTFNHTARSKSSQYLNFFNQGTVAIRCRWKQIWANPTTFPVHKNEDTVMFDKCPFLILPGKSYDVLFMVQANSMGIFKEKWKLESSPRAVKSGTVKQQL